MIPGFIKLMLNKLRPKKLKPEKPYPEHLRVGDYKLPKGVKCIRSQPPPDFGAHGFVVEEPLANRMRQK